MQLEIIPTEVALSNPRTDLEVTNQSEAINRPRDHPCMQQATIQRKETKIMLPGTQGMLIMKLKAPG